jgi:hypothetical protein
LCVIKVQWTVKWSHDSFQTKVCAGAPNKNSIFPYSVSNVIMKHYGTMYNRNKTCDSLWQTDLKYPVSLKD